MHAGHVTHYFRGIRPDMQIAVLPKVGLDGDHEYCLPSPSASSDRAEGQRRHSGCLLDGYCACAQRSFGHSTLSHECLGYTPGAVQEREMARMACGRERDARLGKSAMDERRPPVPESDMCFCFAYPEEDCSVRMGRLIILAVVNASVRGASLYGRLSLCRYRLSIE